MLELVVFNGHCHFTPSIKRHCSYFCPSKEDKHPKESQDTGRKQCAVLLTCGWKCCQRNCNKNARLDSTVPTGRRSDLQIRSAVIDSFTSAALSVHHDSATSVQTLQSSHVRLLFTTIQLKALPPPLLHSLNSTRLVEDGFRCCTVLMVPTRSSRITTMKKKCICPLPPLAAKCTNITPIAHNCIIFIYILFHRPHWKTMWLSKIKDKSRTSEPSQLKSKRLVGAGSDLTDADCRYHPDSWTDTCTTIRYRYGYWYRYRILLRQKQAIGCLFN